MIAEPRQLSSPRDVSVAVPPGLYTGEVVYLYAYDIAYELERDPLRELLGQELVQFSVDASKRSPRQLFFYRPQMVRLRPVERDGPHGPVRLERTVKVLSVGAISIAVRVPFKVERVEELVEYHDLRFGGATLHDEVRDLAEEIRRELEPHCVRPVSRLAEEEAYTVFCFESPLPCPGSATLSAEKWFQNHRRAVAALLTQEPAPEQLSDQEARESTSRYLSYYEDDLVVVDWDAAMVVDERADTEETLHVMELANAQLAELEAYDRILDEALERSYRDMGSHPLRRRSHVLSELREIRIDLARLSDELSNITKFFGDWHLARVYQHLSARFHLADWHHTIDEKLKTLDDLYQLLKQDQTNRWMLILETTIVLLFIIDLILLFGGTGKP